MTSCGSKVLLHAVYVLTRVSHVQVYAPLGHALGMGAVSAAMEDACFQVLFPESYASTSHWLHTVVDPAEDALYAAQQQLLLALESTEAFTQRAAGCVVRGHSTVSLHKHKHSADTTPPQGTCLIPPTRLQHALSVICHGHS